MPGQQDLWPWLQSIMQNQGAGQPMNPNAIPAAAPQAMPGSGVNGMPAMTQGGPSMGFPAMGQPPMPAPQGALAQQGDANPHGDGPPDVMSPAAMAAAQPQPQPQPVQGGQGGIGAYPDSTNYPHSMTPPTFNYPPSSTPTGMPTPPGSPSATPRPVGSGAKGPLASPTNTATPMKRTAGAPNLGYYQPSNRFIGIAQPNASAQNSMRAGPQATALNLGGLFGGRGQQPAANPANVPAANAQPVSAVANGPTPYGPDIPRLNPSGNLALTGGNSPGPNQFSSVPVPLPPAMPGGIRNQRVANAVRNPNWWQNL